MDVPTRFSGRDMTDSDDFGRPEQAPARDAPLCKNCRYIFDHWYRRPGGDLPLGNVWYISEIRCTPRHLLLNARTCPSCYILLSEALEAVVSIVRSDPVGIYEVNLLRTSTTHGTPIHAHMIILRFEKDSGELFLKYSVEKTREGSITDVEDFVPSIPDDIDHPVTWKRIKQWVDTCWISSSHAQCRNRVLDQQIPARLIRIPQKLEDLYLFPTDDIDDKAIIKYATLTHCWGTGKIPLKTTTANIRDMQIKIPFDALGKTFQDAVKTCYQFKLEYLWIDSLCIIQDDGDDWTRQASIMGKIYSGCSLNIVAGSSERDSDGFLATRKERSVKEFVTTARFDDNFGGSEEIYGCSKSSIPFGKMATSTRAWCFQETFLAPRSVYFHDDGVYWECRAQCAHEIFPTGFHTNPPLKRLSAQAFTKEKISTPDIVTHGDQRTYLDRIGYRNWFHLIEKYSECQLTYRKDKLVAFAGIARLLSVNYHVIYGTRDDVQNYLAGLWRMDLYRQLLWSASRTRPRPEALHAPSWSWASTDSKIRFPYRDWKGYQTNFEILTATTVLSSKDEYGAVDGGLLQLRCNSLVPVSIMEKEMGGYRLMHKKSIVTYSHVYPDVEPFNTTELLAFNSWKEDLWTHGLLLTPTGVADTFRHVGAYNIMGSEPAVTRIEELGQKRNVPISSILPFNTHGERITISLV